MIDEALVARFVEHVDKTSDSEGCWRFQGYHDRDGYAQFRVGSQALRAHRVAWMIRHGDIPEGVNVLHSCGRYRVDGHDQPGCCNPAHLRLGSQRDNARDLAERGTARPTLDTAALVRAAQLRAEGRSWESVVREVGCTKPSIRAGLRRIAR